LYAYWVGKKGSRTAPPKAAIRTEELPPTLLPYLALLDVIGEPPRFRIRLFGTGLSAAYGEDVSTKFLDEIDLSTIGPDILTYLTALVRERRPQAVRVQLRKQVDGRRIEYERIGLPLSEDGAAVNMILCGFVPIRTWH
jgi:hypothetical protein